MTPDGEHRLELLIVEGFSAVRGDINRLAQSQGHTAQEVEDHEGRLRVLEKAKVPERFVQGILSMAAIAVALYAALGKG